MNEPHVCPHGDSISLMGCPRFRPNTASISRSRPSLKVFAKQSYYEILDVPQSCTAQEVKRSYRKKAMKLHPDVNSAPDAQERFMEAKAAYETLVNDASRTEYDRRLRMGDSNSWGNSDFSGYKQGGRKQEEEDNYSFEDLMKDLDKEFSDWGKERRAKKGSSKPMSLWDELEDIGGELLDFLEGSLGVDDDKKTSSKGYDPFGEDNKINGNGSNSSSYTETRSTSSTSSSKRPPPAYRPPPPPLPPKSAEDDVDEMLAALKKKLNKQ
eukprot:gene1455-32831_t